jgi:hypothetical protein
MSFGSRATQAKPVPSKPLDRLIFAGNREFASACAGKLDFHKEVNFFARSGPDFARRTAAPKTALRDCMTRDDASRMHSARVNATIRER